MSSSTSKRIGKYEIISRIARTDHAAVYRAEDGDTKRPVAVKILRRSSIKADALPAFRKQAQTLARLEHPSIAACVDVVDNDAAFGLVAEYCEGMAVSNLLKDGAAPELRNVWDIVRPMLEALAAAHALGAPHRDLKPSNLILAADGSLRVTDFGTSTLLKEPSPGLHYRAPEQFNDGQLGSRTDVYQAGAIIYQLVTGKVPFDGTNEEIVHRIFEERPSDPSSYNNRIAWQLDWVIQKALSKDPAERFPSASEFADGLRLGLQETVGRPLDPISLRTAPKPAVSAVPAPAGGKAAVSAPAKATHPLEKLESVPVPKADAKPAFEFTLELRDDLPPEPKQDPDDKPRKAEPKVEVKPAPKVEPKIEAKIEPKIELKVEPKVEPKIEPKVEPKPAATVAPIAPAGPAKPRVLFVDDDERILNALRALFRTEYDVLTATSGEAALELVAAGGIHVVVSDQRMPGLTGVELLRKVRVATPNALRLLLTGYADLASLVGSINDGEIFRFVKKPWDNDEIRKELADAMKIALEQAQAAPAEPASAASARTSGSLLVIDAKEGLGKGLERLLAGTAQVIQVTNAADAARALAAHEIAAIVADLGAGMDGLVSLFKTVKAKRPNVHSILLADEPDSDLGIELINKAQIFRFLPKPVSAKELRHQVSEALRRYATARESALAKSAGDGGANAPAAAVARSA